MKSLIKQHKFFIVFSVLYIAFAFLTYKDYGVTYDEHVEYSSGTFLLSYLKNPTKVDYVDKLVNDRPVHIEARQLPLYSVYSRVYPAFLNIFNPNYYFEWFHLGNLIFGYFLFLFSYLLFFLHYKEGNKSFVGPLLILLTPTLFGHIPANSKDIPFATLYVLGILVIYWAQTRKLNPYLETLLIGGVLGLAVSQRTVALTLYVLYFILELVHKKFTFKHIWKSVLKMGVISSISLLVWVAALPFLGANLGANLVTVLRNAAGYPEWDHEILYFGKFLMKDQRPWHYLYYYMLIKLPLIVLIGFFAGLIAFIIKKIKYDLKHPVMLLGFLFILNSFLYLVLRPVVYNAIRHFLYLVTTVVLIAAFFLVDIFDLLKGKIRMVFLVIMGLYGFFTIARMVHLHPYEYIYYNELIGGIKGAVGKFDLEYWGAGYKEGAEYVRDLIRKKDLENIKVYPCDNQFAVVYFSQFEYELVNRSRDAQFVICDTHKDSLRGYYDKTHPIIKPIEREGVTIFNIRARKDFIIENILSDDE